MVTDSMSSGFEPLTERELEILALLSEDLSDREIAARLHLSPTTVKWYNRQIFQKLGVENRRQAAERASALGLLGTAPDQGTPPHNLPNTLTPFVGRIGELEEIVRWLVDPQNRLLTLVAPGGMGKSRLAIAAAASALSQFPDGAFFVPLAPVTGADAVASHVASAVRAPSMQDGRAPQQQLCDFLSNKRLLLVLDNFEHLLDAADLVTAMLQAGPALKVLVTSRERLNLSVETVYPISGLQYPTTGTESDLGEYGAVQLFVQSAQRADPHFAGHDEDIAYICRLVQGMPLAIELAAAWVSMMTPAEIAAEIERSADFLSTTARDVPERQRSVRAVFDMTWARLTEPERTAFAAMSVFRGGCTQEAALQVTGASKPVIAALVGKALLWRNSRTGRLSVHELLRQYAEKALESSDQAASVRDAHRTYYAAYTDKWSPALRDDQLNALDHLDREYDNIVQAFEAAIDLATPDSILPFTGLWNYIAIRGLFRRGARLFDASIEVLEGTDSVALARSLTSRAVIAMNESDSEAQANCAARSVEMHRRIGADRELPFALFQYGHTLYNDHEHALDVYYECVDLATKSNDFWLMAIAAHVIGMRLRVLGRIAEARPWTEHSHAYELELNNPWGLAFTYYGLYDQARAEGDLLTAQRMLEESLRASQRIGLASLMLYACWGLADIMLTLERPLEAKSYALEMLRIARHSGIAAQIEGSLLVLAEICASTGEIAESVCCLKEARQLGLKTDIHRIDQLQIGSVILLCTGSIEVAAALLTVAVEHPSFVDPMEREYRLRRRLDDIETCRRQLGDARYEEIVEAARHKSLDELHAELYAILNSPPFVQ